MAKSRCAVTLLALVVSAATLSLAALAADVCQNPTFRFAQGSPFKLRRAGVDSQPTALAAGTYLARPGVQTWLWLRPRGRDANHERSAQGFVARMRGNDDGTFTGTQDALHPVDGIPVAIATGRFRTDAPVDGIVVVTSTGQGNGQVQVFVPGADGTYQQNSDRGIPGRTEPGGDHDRRLQRRRHARRRGHQQGQFLAHHPARRRPGLVRQSHPRWPIWAAARNR